MDDTSFGKLVLAIAIIALGLAYGLYPEAPSNAAQVIAAAGFTDIKLTNEAHLFRCSKGDYTAVSFEATNAVGTRVSGTVCCGWLKSCTVRF
jgi:hypothetical protein